MKEVKKHLQGWACFSGNFPSSLLKTGTSIRSRMHTKQLLDDLAGDGGYYMVNGAVLDEANGGKPARLHRHHQRVRRLQITERQPGGSPESLLFKFLRPTDARKFHSVGRFFG